MNTYTFETEQSFGEVAEWFKPYQERLPLLYRLTGTRDRIYFTSEEQVTVYASGTTLIDNYKDKQGEMALEKWRRDLINAGKNPAEVLKERQDYGTLLHLCYGKILHGLKLTFEELESFANSLMPTVGFSKEEGRKFVAAHLEELSKDLASFVAWMKAFNVRPVAVELMIKSDKYRVATAVDFVGYITVEEKGFWGEVYQRGANKGQPKESKKPVDKFVIVDFKSGKGTGFYPANILQLLLNRVMWEENFPEIKLDGIYNFSPSNWQTSPTFQFYDQERDTQETSFLSSIQENVFERGKEIFLSKQLPKRTKVFTGDIFDEGSIQLLTMQEIAEKYMADYEKAKNNN